VSAPDLGLVLPQYRVEWDDVRSAALEAEELGLDSVWVVDHLQSMAPDMGVFEAWTVLSALAAATERVELGAQVFCQSFRNPALFAKMAATLDRVSGGRFRLLIGAGWYEDEYAKFGYDFPRAGVLVEQLREALTILHGMLSGKDEPFTFQGEHYRVSEVRNLPQPVRAPMPIEIGGARDRVLRTVARQGDGWNCPAVALGVLDERLEFLRAECEKAGRSIDELRLTVQITCTIGDEEAESRPDVAMFGPQTGLRGSVDEAVDRVGELISKGISGFHCIAPRGSRGRPILERLATEVRPQL
jgi:alkanesulfonate monooxygenase SsuD/methylene tetrahydromethanopterin reductase-like flavin-dependent oxidoreductase (luciferase family)